MSHKVRIFAEPGALTKLFNNGGFKTGRNLKEIFRNLSNIVLIMDEELFATQWNDTESHLRKLFNAYDLPCPKAVTGLKMIYSDPTICCELDPFAIWLLDKPEKDLSYMRDLLGVWAINPAEMTDDFFCLEYPKAYPQKEGVEITGPKGNGWGNYLCGLTKPLPPINSLIINDRFLLANFDEDAIAERGFFGLNNLVALFDELIPKSLKVPFHIFIYCQHPKLSIETTDVIVERFVDDVKGLRDYEIVIEFVFDTALHHRTLYTNYFRFNANRGYNAFCDGNMIKLNGENIFRIMTYSNNPFSMGDTEYEMIRNDIQEIKEQSIRVKSHPRLSARTLEKIERAQTDCTDDEKFFYNRLFS